MKGSVQKIEEKKKYLTFYIGHLHQYWQVAKRWNYYYHNDLVAIFKYIT